ncbi:MAG: ABC transporter ATP-binding protein [Chloroflexi bacterium]|nr:ABC transporter ATP-binding protein [Chloroflexota bacterium]MDL1882629.1 ABC transporter ATP-binding protein [Anaerolineae bacterium CFX8]
MPAVVETRSLRKQYHLGDVTVEALRGVDFAAAQGEFVAIMGPSGSGKSTLLHLLGGLDSASGGDVLLDGRSYTQMSDDELTITRRRQIGFIFQFFNLLPTLTAAENVALPLTIDGQRPDAAYIMSLLEQVGLADRKDHKPHQLSGGQQQRVAIARALVAQPKIVLADEPTGNLDSQSGQAVLDLLRRASREQGQTMVMVTHDHRAAANADRVVFLKDGQTVNMVSLDDTGGKTRTQTVAAVMTEVGL